MNSTQNQFWIIHINTKTIGFNMYTACPEQDFLGQFKLQTIRQEITGTSYEEMDGKFYVDRNGSLRTITSKDDDDELALSM